MQLDDDNVFDVGGSVGGGDWTWTVDVLDARILAGGREPLVIFLFSLSRSALILVRVLINIEFESRPLAAPDVNAAVEGLPNASASKFEGRTKTENIDMNSRRLEMKIDDIMLIGVNLNGRR